MGPHPRQAGQSTAAVQTELAVNPGRLGRSVVCLCERATGRGPHVHVRTRGRLTDSEFCKSQSVSMGSAWGVYSQLVFRLCLHCSGPCIISGDASKGNPAFKGSAAGVGGRSTYDLSASNMISGTRFADICYGAPYGD